MVEEAFASGRMILDDRSDFPNGLLVVDVVNIIKALWFDFGLFITIVVAILIIVVVLCQCLGYCARALREKDMDRIGS